MSGQEGGEACVLQKYSFPVSPSLSFSVSFQTITPLARSYPAPFMCLPKDLTQRDAGAHM